MENPGNFRTVNAAVKTSAQATLSVQCSPGHGKKTHKRLALSIHLIVCECISVRKHGPLLPAVKMCRASVADFVTIVAITESHSHQLRIHSPCDGDHSTCPLWPSAWPPSSRRHSCPIGGPEKRWKLSVGGVAKIAACNSRRFAAQRSLSPMEQRS